MLLFLATDRRRQLASDAARARGSTFARRVALYAVAVYNLVGCADIWSTHVAISLGLGEEANPVMRAAMDNFGFGWVWAKLFLQLLITGMVLWFPHRVVLTMFVLAVAFNAGVVWSNLKIAGLL